MSEIRLNYSATEINSLLKKIEDGNVLTTEELTTLKNINTQITNTINQNIKTSDYEELITTSKKIVGAINENKSQLETIKTNVVENSTQIKDIANQVPNNKDVLENITTEKINQWDNSIGILTSPNGSQFLLKVKDDGTLFAEEQIDYIPNSELPSDFPRYTVTGESSLKNDFLITPHNDSTTNSYIFIMDYKGRVKKYKKVNKFAYSFRKYTNSQGQIRYTYHECINHLFPKFAMNGGYDNNELVIMDENFEEIKRVRCKASGTVEDNYPLENHDYIYIDDNHYIVTSYHNNTVTNVPSVASCSVVNCIIQEIKDNAVVFHWESIDYVELYSASHTNNNFAGFASTTYNDYAHLNSVQIDSRDGNLLCSFRHIGLMKIHRTTGEIIWIMGRGNIESSKKLNGFTSAQCGHLQHDARYNYDNSITIFDNSGCATDNTRICRYWINEETKTLTDFKEYKIPINKTAFMGYAKLIDDKNEIFDVAGYGAKGSILAFNEYNFKTNTEQMKFKFNDNSDTYRIFRDITDDEVIKNITKPCTNITLNTNTLTFTDTTPQTLTVTVTPTDTTDKVTWNVSPSGACVINDGVVVPKKNGECVITTTCGNQSATCNVSISGLSEDIDSSNCAYSLSSPFKGNGVDSYLDTNWSPYDETKDWTIILKASQSKSITTWEKNYNIISCLRETQPYAGIHVVYSGVDRRLWVNVGSNTQKNPVWVLEDSDFIVIAIKKSGNNYTLYNIETETNNQLSYSSSQPSSINQSLLLCAGYDDKGLIHRFSDIEIQNLYIWDNVLDDTIINSYITILRHK